jgi:hypothetical protein
MLFAGGSVFRGSRLWVAGKRVTQSEVAAMDVALGGRSSGNLAAGIAFPWRHQTPKTLQNALPAVDCQRCCLQAAASSVAADSGSRLNE